MLTTDEKSQIVVLLEEKLGVESHIIKNLNSNILLNVQQILVAYREDYLKADSDIYERRADKLARQLQTILATSIKNFDTKIEVLKKSMGEIADDKIHFAVNGKLDKISAKLDDMKGCMDLLTEDAMITRKKIMYFAYFNAMDKKPLRTILLTALFVVFIAGTFLQVYNIKFDLFQIGRNIVEFIIRKI